MSTNPEHMQELIEKVAQYEELLSASAPRLAALEKAAALIPQVVDALIKSGSINEEHRNNALAKLSDPAYALEALQKLASTRLATKQAAESNVASMGRGATAQKAATATREKPMKESDRVFLEGFNLA